MRCDTYLCVCAYYYTSITRNTAERERNRVLGMTSISVVVPVFNEEGNVANLHQEIKQMCEANNYNYEIIFVNDGSSIARKKYVGRCGL